MKSKMKLLAIVFSVMCLTGQVMASDLGGSGYLSSDSRESASYGYNGGSNGGTNGGNNGGNNGGGGNGNDCTRTQGYWGSSPAGQALLIVLVGGGGMDLGNVNYNSGQLDDILDLPTGGNALVSLAHQLIAAKANVLSGADDSEVADDISAADVLIGNLVVPPVGAGDVAPNTPLGMNMLAVKDVLDSYNNGQLNVPHCD